MKLMNEHSLLKFMIFGEKIRGCYLKNPHHIVTSFNFTSQPNINICLLSVAQVGGKPTSVTKGVTECYRGFIVACRKSQEVKSERFRVPNNFWNLSDEGKHRHLSPSHNQFQASPAARQLTASLIQELYEVSHCSFFIPHGFFSINPVSEETAFSMVTQWSPWLVSY